MAIPALKSVGLALVLSLVALLPHETWAAGDEVAAYKRAVEKNFAQWLQALWPEAEGGRGALTLGVEHQCECDRRSCRGVTASRGV